MKELGYQLGNVLAADPGFYAAWTCSRRRIGV